MGKASRSGCWSVILLLPLLPAAAQVDGTQPTPLRFQPSPTYHSPLDYPRRHQRLLLQLSSTEFHVFRNAEIDLDSSLHLRESFDNPDAIRWHVDIQPLKVGLRKAVPIALILNESVTNSLKHAFPAGRHGLIAIRFRHDKERVSLSVSDNGVGLRRSPEETVSESVGIVLIKGLSEELGGNIQISSDNGTTVSVQFQP